MERLAEGARERLRGRAGTEETALAAVFFGRDPRASCLDAAAE